MRFIKAITFDLDNTLWETDQTILRAEAHMKEHLESLSPSNWMVDFTLESFYDTRATIVKRHPEIAHQLSILRKLTIHLWFSQQGAKADVAAHLAEEGSRAFYNERQKVQPYPGTEKVLKLLASRLPLATITNGNADVLSMPIGRHFQFALLAQDFHAPKPDPVMFEEALMRFRCAPQECLHVGDDVEHDVNGAAQLGIQTVWLNNKSEPLEKGSHADYTINKLPELIKLI